MPAVRQTFLKAVRSGNAKDLEESIAFGANVRWRLLYEHARTALHYVAEEGFQECVKVLVNSRADVNSIDDACCTPVHLAAINGHAECIRLIGATAQLDKHDKHGYTPLHWAALKGQSECVIALLDLDADIDADPHQSTALGFAAKQGETECVNILCERKANVNESGDWGWTPLARAAEIGNIDICKMLIYCSAKVDIANVNGDTPVHHAASKGHLQICKLLVERERPLIISILGATASPLPNYLHVHIAEFLYDERDCKLVLQRNNKGYSAYNVAQNRKVKEYLKYAFLEGKDCLCLANV